MSVSRAPSIPAPSVQKRLGWWLGLYLLVQLPYLPATFSFPEGLAAFLCAVFFIEAPSAPLYTLFLVLAYGFYPAHLLACLLVRKQKTFHLLMGVLALVLVIDIYYYWIQDGAWHKWVWPFHQPDQV